MKKLLLLLLAVPALVQAQIPWQGFLPGKTAHYEATPTVGPFSRVEGLEAVYEVARFDSSFTHGPNAFYIPMKTAGTMWWKAYGAYPGNVESEGGWMGPIVRMDSVEEEYFPKHRGSLLLYRKRVRMGDTAFVWMGTPARLYGICDSLRAGTVLGEPDSLVTLRLVHYDSAGGAGSLMGQRMWLSRSHGWVRALNFYHLGEDTLTRSLTMLSGTGHDYRYVPFSEYYQLRPGDKVHATTRIDNLSGSGGFCILPRCRGLNGIYFQKSHRTFVRRQRYSHPSREALLWVDSNVVFCYDIFRPQPLDTAYALQVDTLGTSILPEDSIPWSGASLEYTRLRGGQNSYLSPALVRIKGQLVRLEYSAPMLDGGGFEVVMPPFGRIHTYYDKSNSGTFICRNEFTVAYATSPVDTTGNPDPLASMRPKANARLISLSPNPTTGIVRVEAVSAKPIWFEVIRMDGAVLRTSVVSGETRLDLTQLPGGLYAWRASDGRAVQTGRLVRE